MDWMDLVSFTGHIYPHDRTECDCFPWNFSEEICYKCNWNNNANILKQILTEAYAEIDEMKRLENCMEIDGFPFE